MAPTAHSIATTYSYNLMVSESNWLRFVSDAADPETAAIMLCNPIFSAVF